MTIRDLLEYGEKCLREDNEYWEQIDKFKRDIDELVNQHNKIITATIIRTAVTMVTRLITAEEGEKNDKDYDGIIRKG